MITDFTPKGDQPQAIDALIRGLRAGKGHQVLLGVTGSGKTFTMAKLIESVGKPALVLTHNKTLAAQLYREFKDFFPGNAVEYFVSYYDYYQPEAYVASKDLYIEKDSSINDEIERLRLLATSSILERRDVVVVSSVSCIYGLGNPIEFERMRVLLMVGEEFDRDLLLRKLVDIQYTRNDIAFTRGTFRVRGDIVEIFLAYRDEVVRVEFFGDEVEQISIIHPVSGAVLSKQREMRIYPAKHFVQDPESIRETISIIATELEEQLAAFKAAGKLVEAQRLESRTRYDMEMLAEMGYCSGIENYSRVLARREPGSRPDCLLDYFRKNYLMLVDESHVTLPQVRGMHEGDRARKQNLVDYGFRLPCALDNRPLRFDEFEQMIDQAVFVTATPADFELEHSRAVVEQVIRPTGLLDPEIQIRPAGNQVDDLMHEIRRRTEAKERVLVTTLTKKMAEDLSKYFEETGINAKYLHSEIETIERVELIRDLRKGVFDVLIGINLLREGLDIPEVSLVAILDADKEGFLRSARSLIQTAGRAARNVNGTVIMYADKITDSMQKAIDETKRRRSIQKAYNEKHGITPTTISKEIRDIIEREYRSDDAYAEVLAEYREKYSTRTLAGMKELQAKLREDMLAAADALDFERAALLRDEMNDLSKKIEMKEKVK